MPVRKSTDKDFSAFVDFLKRKASERIFSTWACECPMAQFMNEYCRCGSPEHIARHTEFNDQITAVDIYDEFRLETCLELSTKHMNIYNLYANHVNLYKYTRMTGRQILKNIKDPNDE